MLYRVLSLGKHKAPELGKGQSYQAPAEVSKCFLRSNSWCTTHLESHLEASVPSPRQQVTQEPSSLLPTPPRLHANKSHQGTGAGISSPAPLRGQRSTGQALARAVPRLVSRLSTVHGKSPAGSWDEPLLGHTAAGSPCPSVPVFCRQHLYGSSTLALRRLQPKHRS